MVLVRDLQRTCLVSRTTMPVARLLRFVLSPEGQVVVDLKNRLPGRGVWIERTRAKVQEAVKKKLFSKGFKQEARVAPDLPDEIDSLLVRDLRQALALANKAGMVVAGFAKVDNAIKNTRLAAVVQASDGGDDGHKKIVGALHKRFKDTKSVIPVIDVLSNNELSLALGRSHVIHAAVTAGAGSNGLLKCWVHLCDYRGMDPSPPTEHDTDL